MTAEARIWSDSLLQELVNYGAPSKEQLCRKALRVEVKCLRAGKKALAARIHAKYHHLYPQDDATMAFGLVFAAHLMQ